MADGVNVDDDVVRIKTEVTDAGSKVEAVYRLQELDEFTRARRDGQFDDDFEFSPGGRQRARSAGRNHAEGGSAMGADVKGNACEGLLERNAQDIGLVASVHTRHRLMQHTPGPARVDDTAIVRRGLRRLGGGCRVVAGRSPRDGW